MTNYVGQIKRPNRAPIDARLTLDRSKRQYDSVTVTTTAYTVFDKTYILVDDATAGGQVTITLPPAIDSTDRIIYIKKLGATANVVVDGNGSETIDGSTTQTISSQYGTLTLVCSGAAWFIF